MTASASAKTQAARAFVLLVMSGACLVLWIGIPVGVLWGLSKVTSSSALHAVLGIFGVAAAMVAFAPALFWLNQLYLRITGVLARLEEDERESGWQRRVGGPLEPMLVLSLVVAFIALTIFFFFFATNPSGRVW